MYAGWAPFHRGHFLEKPIEFVHFCGQHYQKRLITDLLHLQTFHTSLCVATDGQQLWLYNMLILLRREKKYATWIIR